MKSLGDYLFKFLVIILGLWLALDIIAHLIAEIFWFQEVEFLPVFLKRVQTQLILWVFVFLFSMIFLLGNLILAQRFRWHSSLEFLSGELIRSPQTQPEDSNLPSRVKTPITYPWGFSLLLPVVILLGLLVSGIILYYGQAAVEFWHPDFTLPNIAPRISLPLLPGALQTIGMHLSPYPWLFGIVVLILFIAIVLVQPQFLLSAIAIILSLIFSFFTAGNWNHFLQYVNPTSFNKADPVFNNDISFYIFRLPVWEVLNFWLVGLFLYSLVAVALLYLLSGNSISNGKFPGFSLIQLRHLLGLGGAFMLSLGVRHWLSRYELLYSPRGVTFGASYTDVFVQLPVNTGLAFVAGAIALWLFFKGLVSPSRPLYVISRYFPPFISPTFIIIGVYLLAIGIAGFFLPTAVQNFLVQPNELFIERPFIERSIALTRAAFGLDLIDAELFTPEGTLTTEDIEENDLTIDNIRLWDTRPLLETNRQLQRIRLYYEFPDADIDRYTLLVDADPIPATDTFINPEEDTPTLVPQPQAEDPNIRSQQIIIAARELDYNSVPEDAQTWVNEHLIYTHGYGFTLSPVNQVGEGGLPVYFVWNIGTGTDDGAAGKLDTSSELIRESIPIGRPRIYYGELTDTYVMTATNVPELDYPSGDENVYNTYDGTGGIPIGVPWRRLLFSEYLRDWRMLFAQNFTPDTRLLFRRNINERVRAIAPFLQYDRDPYLVAADAEIHDADSETYLYWIIDAYTTSDYYPYSDPGDRNFNYIRNSVKVVVDAYNGKARFYVADTTDPIIQTWSRVFPNLFEPLENMPVTLRDHIRYPIDFFTTQSERLLIYHMTDPQVFYNREDEWRIPQEIYGDTSQPVDPYYLIMRLPTEVAEEFIILHPFTPPHRNNLIGWLAGRSDGEQYGRLLLYQFPKEQLIYGPEQIEALINQDPVISQQISLWNRQGSRAIQGNLLVIPIENSLLYVEPLYLESTETSLPTLVRVIVVYENRIVMAETLEESLQAIFSPEIPETPAIIRPLEDLPTAVDDETDLTAPN